MKLGRDEGHLRAVGQDEIGIVAPLFDGNITFAYESSECLWEADEG